MKITDVATPDFWVGLHRPWDAWRFEKAMISINRLEHRKSDINANKWILDSGAFTRIASGKSHMPVEAYARQIRRWKHCGDLVAAVSQDYMCEPFILDVTGLNVLDHQLLTLRRYDQLLSLRPSVYIMPVLQGYQPLEYSAHIGMYGSRLAFGAWVGVGSVCKRNAKVGAVEAVLLEIYACRPDLRLHGFGLKKTALESPIVNDLIASCDSMAWSSAARYAGRDQNDPGEAQRYIDDLPTPTRRSLFSANAPRD